VPVPVEIGTAGAIGRILSAPNALLLTMSARALTKRGERAMVAMLYILAALEFIGGIGVIAWSRGAIPEILGTLVVGFSISTVGLASVLAEVAWSRKLLERQVVWSRKLLETQMVLNEVLKEQYRQAAEQVDRPLTYRGYSYLASENGVVLKLKDGGLKHFSSEEEAVAYVDSVTGGEGKLY
jgi:hypothetical protein